MVSFKRGAIIYMYNTKKLKVGMGCTTYNTRLHMYNMHEAKHM